MDWVATVYIFFFWGLDGNAVNERYPIESCQLLAGDQTNQWVGRRIGIWSCIVIQPCGRVWGHQGKHAVFFFAWCAHSISWDSQPASQPQMKVLNPQPWGSNPYECRLILHIDSTDKLLSMLRHGMSWTRNKCQSSFKPVRPALPVRLDSGIKLSWRHWNDDDWGWLV